MRGTRVVNRRSGQQRVVGGQSVQERLASVRSAYPNRVGSALTTEELEELLDRDVDRHHDDRTETDDAEET